MTEETPTPKVIVESRIDEPAASAFKAMGYEAPLSDNMINFYKRFKRHRDMLQPSRLTPEGYATVAVLTDMVEGRVVIADDDNASTEE